MKKNERGQVAVLATGIIGLFIFVIVATALLPALANQVSADINGGVTNLSTTDQTLLRLWPTMVVIGGLIAILAAIGLG